jgi:hypothetical protein
MVMDLTVLTKPPTEESDVFDIDVDEIQLAG